MSRWFRMYDEILDDPKVQKLSAEDFRGWVNLLCLASKNDGRFPPIEDIAFALRETPDAVSTLLERLRSGGLIARRSGGPNGAYDAPNNWNERQYKSDTSTERVKRFRKRQETLRETAPETDTETEYSEDKSSGAKAPAKPVFDLGISILAKAGCSAKEARSLVGKWRKARGETAVREAFEECMADEVSEPVAWLTRRLERAPYVSASGYEYRGDIDQVIRESEKRADWNVHWRAVGDKRRSEEQAA